MKRQKKQHRFYKYGLLLVIVFGLWQIFPSKITIVNPNLEDVNKYLAALIVEDQRNALQKTMPEGVTVVDAYTDQPKYFQVTDTCDFEFTGSCVHIRTGPGISYPEAFIYYENQGAFPARVRMGQVFPMSGLVKAEDGSLWYKIDINKDSLMFPERIRTDWYVSAQYFNQVDFTPVNPDKDSIKKIIVILHEQTLYAYEGDTLFMKTKVSTGQDIFGLSTGKGDFQTIQKIPMAIMEGPLPGFIPLINSSNIKDFEYTLFVPYAVSIYVGSMGTAFIHEAYWHNGFGTERSHGCVNVSPKDEPMLYNWIPDPSKIQIPVTIIP